jgi:hypothetical protein
VWWIKGNKDVHVFIFYDKMLYNANYFLSPIQFCGTNGNEILKIMPFWTIKHAYVRYNQLSAIGGRWP